MSECICFEHVHETDSTNAELSRRIASGRLCTPFCLSADAQTAGRGRRGRSWLNTKGALMMSLACDTSGIANGQLPLISIAAALGVYDAVSRYLPNIAVKWPNDIVCTDGADPEKLCGILCELVFAPSSKRFAVIGIGLNLNSAALPSELMIPATSVRIKLGNSVEPELMKLQIASSVFARANSLRADPEMLIREYSSRCTTLGSFVAATDLSGKVICEGVARRILPDGRLAVETKTGEAFVDAADVSIRPGLNSKKQ